MPKHDDPTYVFEGWRDENLNMYPGDSAYFVPITSVMMFTAGWKVPGPSMLNIICDPADAGFVQNDEGYVVQSETMVSIRGTNITIRDGGDDHYLTVVANEGYEFDYWEDQYGNNCDSFLDFSIYYNAVDIVCHFKSAVTHEHAIKETHQKVDPTCTEAGHEKYYECDCGAYFSDEGLTQNIDNIDTWLADDGAGYIAPLGHDIIVINGTPATNKADGFKDAYKCNRCGKYFEDQAGTILIGDETAYNAWKLAGGRIPALNPQTGEGLTAGAIAGIIIGCLLLFLIILIVVLYILWRHKNFSLPLLRKVLIPLFRFINNLLFKSKLNKVEAEDAESRAMEEEDYLKALKDESLMKPKKQSIENKQ